MGKNEILIQIIYNDKNQPVMVCDKYIKGVFSTNLLDGTTRLEFWFPDDPRIVIFDENMVDITETVEIVLHRGEPDV